MLCLHKLLGQFGHIKGTFNFAHRPILYDMPFIESGYNSITNAKDLDIQDIIGKLSAVVRRTKGWKSKNTMEFYFFYFVLI
ncbi:MAG: hypothetical protein ACYS91_10600 [Planctomycetota bacterium]|jgi:hypothetical protein